ncbi:MAG: hypothetical protein GIKADHBN_01725 [Phycisphaerales bacterium]|nr:hypothetical protein [Phycisphaerales bacterium]
MNARAIIRRLDQYPAMLAPLVLSLPPEDFRWKPAPEHWSILEICCHLLDEEKEDFRPRLRSTLEDAAREWPALDLDQVAQKRSYNTRDLRQTLDQFAVERAASITWLHTVEAADFSRAYQHPKFGPIYAGDLLASWAAHDALHLRQIARRLHGLAARDAGSFKIAYAGEW